jgi:hypothetical protein
MTYHLAGGDLGGLKLGLGAARYFESVSGTYTVMPGSPRSWLGSLRAEF